MIPLPIQNWLETLPSQNIGTLYARIASPDGALATWHKVDGWGQLCDGRDHKQMVHLMLRNKWPNHGKGYTYLEWRAEPAHPEACEYPLRGKVENPLPYSGIAFD